MNKKLGTFLHVLGGVGRVVDPRIGTIIDGGKALAHAKGEDKVAAALTEIDTGLDLAGDLSGKAAVSDPALRALIRKYVEDGLALHQYIEAHKKAAAAPATASGSTGD